MHPVPTEGPVVPPMMERSSLEGMSIPPPPQHDPMTSQGRPLFLTDFPDGGVTTDMTYTTDEDTMATTSMPPSSGGSPVTSRRQPPPHLYHHRHNNPPPPLDLHSNAHVDPAHLSPTHQSSPTQLENPYVSMQRMSPVYAKVRRDQQPYHQHQRSNSPYSPSKQTTAGVNQ